MRNNKGFTLVELLAVIVIMGILMMVAIPSVTRTIENSRKDTFVDIAKSYANAARNMWTTDNLTCNGTVSSAVDDGDYYILINSKTGAKETLPTLVDQGGKSSWGNRDVNGYVRVNVSTTAGVDSNNDGTYEVEPRRVTKFYVALSDGTHGLVDDDTLTTDELKRGNVVMTLSQEQLKKIELTVEDGKLDCAREANGNISCTAVTPIKDITGVCIDDQTSVALTGRVEAPGGGGGTPQPEIREGYLSGTWKFNDRIVVPSNELTQTIEFTSYCDGQNNFKFTGISASSWMTLFELRYYRTDISEWYLVYTRNDEGNTTSDIWYDNQERQKITFTSEQQVSMEFWNWFTANATKIQ